MTDQSLSGEGASSDHRRSRAEAGRQNPKRSVGSLLVEYTAAL
jgi:hypothetical protein